MNNFTLKILNEDAIIAWHEAIGKVEEAEKLAGHLSSVVSKYLYEHGETMDRVKQVKNNINLFYSRWEEYCGKKDREACLLRISDFFANAKRYNLPFRVDFITEGEDNIIAFYSSNRKYTLVMPFMPECMELVPEEDFGDMTVAEYRARLGVGSNAATGGMIPAEAEGLLTGNGLRSTLKDREDDLSRLKQQMDDVKGAKSDELASIRVEIERMQAELEAKQQALMAELEQKKAELESTKEKLQWQIYLLDSQIYDIRCFAGETVQFKKIMSGKDAPITEPVFIHQKLRFLDEDLPRLASVYHLSWDNIEVFEDILRHNPEALDLFAPDQRCISLVRLTKNGTVLREKMSDIWGNTYYNVLDRFDFMYGNTVGILIRNGENLYLGWTDEERIHIQDDFIITAAQIVTETKPGDAEKPGCPSWEQEAAIQKEKQERRNIADGFISRKFVYSILQGVVEHSNILPLPAGTSVQKEGPYVAFVVSDKWLTDNRFNLSDIIQEVNKAVRKGDTILTVQRLRPEPLRNYSGSSFGVSQSYHNDRGRGDKNRTHDVAASDCTLYPVNLVEYDPPVSFTRYEYGDGCVTSIPTKNASNLCPGTKILETYDVIDRHVFISLVKEGDSWLYPDTKCARANFELYDGEYINLTFLDSVRLSWCINTKSLGQWRIGTMQVDYAYGIRYLKTALDYVKKREEHEAELFRQLNPDILKDAEWPLKLAQWRLEHNIHTLTEYSAKRYAKAYASGRK